MTECEFQKGDDVIRVANKEYPSNSILGTGVERYSYSWFISHQPPSTEPAGLSEFENATEGRKYPGDSWKWLSAFSWQTKKAWGQVSHVDNCLTVQTVGANCPYAHTSPVINRAKAACAQTPADTSHLPSRLTWSHTKPCRLRWKKRRERKTNLYPHTIEEESNLKLYGECLSSELERASSFCGTGIYTVCRNGFYNIQLPNRSTSSKE